jgi:DNA-binding MarR family transcriptional regulator
VRPEVHAKPLVALLSQALVAFTIEADNEFEQRMPHRTAADRGDPAATGPWLTSLTYWSNYLLGLPDDGITARELARHAGDDANSIGSRLNELRRWGYARVQRNGADLGATLVIPTENGRRARDTWAPIEALVTERWRERFGPPADELATLLADAPADLPLGFPVTAWGHTTRIHRLPPVPATGLYSALSRALLTIAREFDAEAPMSLAVSLDFVRIVPPTGAPVRDLPLLAGISKEAIAIQVGRFERNGLGVVQRDERGTKRFALTTDGRARGAAAMARLDSLEAGRGTTSSRLRVVLSGLVGDRMSDGLTPPATGWRASGPYHAQTAAIVADPAAALPWFPMVSHRGGYPDGF